MRLLILTASVILLFCAGSCTVNQRITSAQDKLLEQYRQIPNWDQLPRKALSWRQAVGMLEQNIEMQKARASIKEATRQLNRVYTDFIPFVDIGHFYSGALIKGDSPSPNYGTFDVNVIFSLPSLMRLPVDYYTRSLQLYRVQQETKRKHRELIAKLWQLYRNNDLAIKRIQNEDAVHDAQPGKLILKQRERDLQQREREQQLCALLNDYSARWQPVTSSMPDIQWQDYKKLTQTPDELTQIAMALALESARLQKLGVGMRYLPDFHINFYSPSLFSMTGGSSGGFMSGDTDVRVNLNAYLQIDTRLEIWSDWAQAKENYHLVEEELTQNMHEYRNKMHMLLDSWYAYDEWKSSTQDYIRFRQSQSFYTPEELSKLYAEELQIQTELLEQESKNIERECALIQEYGLPGYESPPYNLPQNNNKEKQ